MRLRGFVTFIVIGISVLNSMAVESSIHECFLAYYSSEKMTVDTCPFDVIDPGAICCSQSGCGPLFDPDRIRETQPPSGGTGNFVFMWLKSEKGFRPNGDVYWTSPEEIRNPDGSIYGGRTYDPPPLSVSTRYRRCVASAECIEAGYPFRIETTHVVINVNDCGCNLIDGGEIAENQESCEDSLDPDPIISISPAETVNPGDPVIYEWYYSFAPAPYNNTDWVQIPGENDESYDPGLTNRSIYLYRRAYNPNCPSKFKLSNRIDILLGGQINVRADVSDTGCGDSPSGSATLDITGSYPPFEVIWSNASEDNPLTGVSAGIYEYTVTDRIGCDTTGTITISDGGEIELNPEIENYDCASSEGGSIALDPSGGTPPYRYVWDNGLDSVSRHDDLLPGTYCVTVTDAAGCSVSECFDMETVGEIPVILDGQMPSCHDSKDGKVWVVDADSTYRYEWSEPGAIEDTLFDVGSGRYCVTITNGIGCMGEGCYDLLAPDSIIIDADITDVKCDGTPGKIALTVSRGTPEYTYDWDDFPGQDTSCIGDLDAGLYCVTVTDRNNCQAEDCFEVMVDDTLTYDIQLDYVKCAGDTVFLNPNGDPNYDFEWRPGDIVSDSTAASPFTCPDQDTTIVVSITDPETGCRGVYRINIKVCNTEPPQIPSVHNFCDSDSLCVDLPSGFGITWATDPGCDSVLTTDTCLLIPDGIDKIYYCMTDTCGCSYDGEVVIDYKGRPWTLDTLYSVCEGDTLVLPLAELNLDSIWFDCPDTSWLSTNLDTFYFTSDRVGLQCCDINYSDDNCVGTQELCFEVFENTHFVNASADPREVNKGLTTRLMAESPNDNDQFYWTPTDFILDSPNDRNPEAMPTEDVIFTVQSTDSLGCHATDTVSIKYTCICDEPYIFVPNAFTPNNDMLNDKYRIVVEEELIEEFYLAIYNRWGELVFETNDLNNNWNGYFNGDLVNADVYAYYLRIKCVGNEEDFVKNGNITVLY